MMESLTNDIYDAALKIIKEVSRCVIMKLFIINVAMLSYPCSPPHSPLILQLLSPLLVPLLVSD